MLMPDSKQLAYEAQTRQFEEHVKHFEQLDEVLQLFAIQHGFALEKTNGTALVVSCEGKATRSISSNLFRRAIGKKFSTEKTFLTH